VHIRPKQRPLRVSPSRGRGPSRDGVCPKTCFRGPKSSQTLKIT
jgi:hypothetical protein